MRIISGTHKGKRLMAPKKLPVRPTTDMAKEGLFNILNNRFYFGDIKILDLCAGTGNISYEFASRGVRDITAVDSHYGCVQYINKTSDALNLNISALKNDVFTFLERTHETYDVIFADPPYDMEMEQFLRFPQLVFEKELLNEEGLLIVEHSPHTNLDNVPHFTEKRKYGSCVFSFFSN